MDFVTGTLDGGICESFIVVCNFIMSVLLGGGRIGGVESAISVAVEETEELSEKAGFGVVANVGGDIG